MPYGWHKAQSIHVRGAENQSVHVCIEMHSGKLSTKAQKTRLRMNWRWRRRVKKGAHMHTKPFLCSKLDSIQVSWSTFHGYLWPLGLQLNKLQFSAPDAAASTETTAIAHSILNEYACKMSCNLRHNVRVFRSTFYKIVICAEESREERKNDLHVVTHFHSMIQCKNMGSAIKQNTTKNGFMYKF